MMMDSADRDSNRMKNGDITDKDLEIEHLQT